MLEQLWRERGIDAVLARCAEAKHKPRPIERALFERIADRALEPYSKLYCWDHPLREEVFLPSTALGDDARAAAQPLVLGREAAHRAQAGAARERGVTPGRGLFHDVSP